MKLVVNNVNPRFNNANTPMTQAQYDALWDSGIAAAAIQSSNTANVIATVNPTAPAVIPFTGAGVGAPLVPPTFASNRYRIGRIVGKPWYQVTTTDLKNTPATIPFVYPPNFPLLQLLPGNDGSVRLCFYNMPVDDGHGATFADCSAFLPYYNPDGSYAFPAGTNRSITNQVQGQDLLINYIQQYVNLYMVSPYDVSGGVPYGMNYFDQWRLNYNTEDKCSQFLSAVNYLVAPIGTKTFWDKFLDASPVIVASLFSIATVGAGSAVLGAAVAIMKAASKKGSAQIANAENLLLSSNVNANAAGLNEPNILETIDEWKYGSWWKYRYYILVLIAATIVTILIINRKK